MRKNNGRRRHRGQNRRNFNNLNKNTVIESFGPISQIRGNVQQLNEKYNNLGNDAASNDDKVLSETYYQFADHYHRLLREIEISNENKNLNGLKVDNIDEKDQNLDVDDEPKPSRKERSIKAKIKEDEENDIEGSIVSLTFRKLFGDFGRGRIPPVIAEKVEEGKDKVVKIILPEPTVTEKQSIVDEYADEIRRELALLFQKESTQFKAYKDIYANFDCRVLENDLYKVLHLLGRAELTFLLEKCKFNEENKVILIANRLNEIDQRDLTLLDHLRISYFKLSVYTPFLTFIAFVILMYELVKKGAINIYTRRKRF